MKSNNTKTINMISISLSLLLGIIISWLIKDGFTSLMFGKIFSHRSLLIQIGILAFLVIFTSTFLLIIFSTLNTFHAVNEKLQQKVKKIIFNRKVKPPFILVDSIMTKKKELLLWGALLCVGAILIEIFVLNWGFFIQKALNLQERRFSPNDGILFQFNLENGALVAKTDDPNIIFEKINLPVAAISIKCDNSIPGAVGQIFYSSPGKTFNETDSIHYDASLPEITLMLNQPRLGIPQPVMISNLRLDLTGIQGDILTCSNFVVNPRVPFKLNFLRLALYVILLFLVIMRLKNQTVVSSRKRVRYHLKKRGSLKNVPPDCL